ncbi:hypothetical protein T03_7808 [Trichinella britovi]|uniref:Uncharacterized protein n=1 Tax=Trichinella britovi TaxID=45882 RepID=A0A0V0ZD76_TRIBR|nr:hypothetical protein T03_7808 [Trichinella britovi]
MVYFSECWFGLNSSAIIRLIFVIGGSLIGCRKHCSLCHLISYSVVI